VPTKNLFITVWLLFFCKWANAAKDTLWNQSPQVFLSSVLDIFYVYDFNQPQTPKRQDFLFNHNRHNEFNVNVGMVKVGLQHPKYRAHFALHAGTYSNDNYAAEPGVLKNIF
jgi:hypothetical protein